MGWDKMNYKKPYIRFASFKFQDIICVSGCSGATSDCPHDDLSDITRNSLNFEQPLYTDGLNENFYSAE